MNFQADIQKFVEDLLNADIGSVRALLQEDPTSGVATLPSGWPVFLEQSMFPAPEIMDLMTEHGADTDSRNPDGETLLHLTGDPETIRMLLSVGADINALEHRGYTPMMGHAPYTDAGPDAIHTLFAEGADPHVIGQDGRTFLICYLKENGSLNCATTCTAGTEAAGPVEDPNLTVTTR